MNAGFLCAIAFIISFIATRRSLVAGLMAVFSFGYFYGILRANLQETASHFTYDAAVIGLYLAHFTRKTSPEQQWRERNLKTWVVILIAWPLLLILAPVQDIMVELVGLRGNIMLLPFLLVGGRLESRDCDKLALWLAGINIVVFGFAVAEYFQGLEQFYPYSAVTEIIYRSNDLADRTAYRIPATFANAHSYAGQMVTALPLLAGAWVQKQERRWRWYLLTAALAASIVGVFMAATRTHMAVLLLLLLVFTVSITLSGGFNLVTAFGWLMIIGGVAWTVSKEEKLQRFTSLTDTDMVVERVYGSVNEGFLQKMVEYPLGNGLGGGGTSMPYFLQDKLKNPVLLENEYARIMLEQGLPGLCLWVGFIIWFFLQADWRRPGSWYLGRRLAWLTCAIYLGTAFMGLGMLTAIPQSSLMLILLGWVVVARRDEVRMTVLRKSEAQTNSNPLLATKAV